MTARQEPSGCRWCGIPKREHGRQWTEPVGWHAHAAPTDAQILARMTARRAARTPSYHIPGRTR